MTDKPLEQILNEKLEQLANEKENTQLRLEIERLKENVDRSRQEARHVGYAVPNRGSNYPDRKIVLGTDLAKIFKGDIQKKEDKYLLLKTLRIKENIILPCAQITVPDGLHLIIEGAELQVQPNTKLRLGKDSSIRVEGGNIHSLGNNQQPIEIYSCGDIRSGSILIEDSLDSQFEYCQFYELHQELKNSRVIFKKGWAKECCSKNGGAASVLGGSVVFDDFVFADNTAEQYGGAVYLVDCLASFEKAIFVANTAKEGGAAYVNGEKSDITFDNQCLMGGNSRPQLSYDESKKIAIRFFMSMFKSKC